MADIALILGESGSGKSRSIKNLPAKHTFVVSPVENKNLPFKGNKTLYPDFNMESGEGNMLRSRSVPEIAAVLKYVNKSRPEIKFIVLDDNQYLGLYTYTSRINEKDWAKFNTITINTLEMIDLLTSFREDMQVYIMQHVESSSDIKGDEKIQAKTLGKFIKEKLTYEGLFTVVLLCDKEETDNGEVKHFFWTRHAKSSVKTPEGMFEDQKIPNDLRIVATAIHNYNI